MHYNERYLERLVLDRTGELTRAAEVHRQTRALRDGWRMRLALALVAVAERLHPAATGRRAIPRYY